MHWADLSLLLRRRCSPRLSPTAGEFRLTAIKKKYDPTNFFRVNHNITPETQAATA
jgi:Berberine and berberine like